MVVIGGRRFFLWRAVDSEGEVLDLLLQRRRDTAAAVTLLRKLLKKQGYAPGVIVTDKLRSYGAAKAQAGLSGRHEQACARTTRPKTRISPPGGVSARCSLSSHRGRPSASFQFMPLFTTRSTFSVISSPPYASLLQGECDGAMAGSDRGGVKGFNNRHLFG
jgi:transposase-like protein